MLTGLGYILPVLMDHLAMVQTRLNTQLISRIIAMPKKYYAHDGQSWWDAICKCKPTEPRIIHSEFITSSEQFMEIQELIGQSNNHKDNIFYMEKPEIQFMLLCFMAAMYDEL